MATSATNPVITGGFNPQAWGDNGFVAGPGVYADPITLPNTQIYGLLSPMIAWAVRVHRQSSKCPLLPELWYQRAGTWSLMPVQPSSSSDRPVEITHRYRQPSQMRCWLPDNDGLLAPGLQTSPANLVGGVFEPLLDEARPVLLRVGIWCYANLAVGHAWSCNTPPSSGNLAALNDGAMAPFTSSLLPTAYCAAWNLLPSATIEMVCDTGAVQIIHHVALRFCSNTATGTLPAFVTIALSSDGLSYNSWAPRPVGGPGGDWEDGVIGDLYETNATEVSVCDLDYTARFVRVTIQSRSDTSQTIALDEAAVYGGATGGWLGMNRFRGYLGDGIQWSPDGWIQLLATDTLKRLADNNETRLTGRFDFAELADIAYSLLTSPSNWRGASGNYDAPLTSAEIGWAAGIGLTGFKFPVWQGQANSQLGYQYELWHEIGWQLTADGNGILQAFEPPYNLRRPARLFIAAPDGNNDARAITRSTDGKQLRNVVEITSGAPQNGQGGSLTQTVPSSVSRYGHRRVVVTDPLAQLPDFRAKAADQILRDYAWNLYQLTADIQPDFDTNLRAVHAFRTAGRLALSAANSLTAAGELWSLMQFDERITNGDWWAKAVYAPYVCQGPAAPQVLQLSTSLNGAQYTCTISWQVLADPHLKGFNIYACTTGEDGPFTLVTTASQLAPSSSSYTWGAYALAQQVWAYATAVDDHDTESLPSVILSVIAGSGGESSSSWTVTDLAAGYGQVSGPDSLGYLTYEFNLTWTSPPAALAGQDNGMFGFKHMILGFSVGSLPPDPTNHWEWTRNPADYRSFNRVPPGMMWDRKTYGTLDWVSRFRTTTSIPPGSTVYYRMWTSNTSLGWHQTFMSNIASCITPA